MARIAAIPSEPATGSWGTNPAKMTSVIGFRNVSTKVGRKCRAAGLGTSGGRPGRSCANSIHAPKPMRSKAQPTSMAARCLARKGRVTAPSMKAPNAYRRSANDAPSAAIAPAANPWRAPVPKISSAIGPMAPATTTPKTKAFHIAALRRVPVQPAAFARPAPSTAQ